MTKIVGLSAGLILAAAGIAGENPQGRVSVLLELFTSEGCSSCPPADRLLQKLDHDQSIAGVEVIVLSEHVDYWNQLGWSDPFSSALYSERQREYAGHLDGQTYTPELVVDGAAGFVGSDEREAERAIRQAAKRAKAPIQVAAERVDKKVKVTLHIQGIADGTLYLALAHDSVKSQVLRGENSGRGLSHVAAAYAIEKIGKVDGKTSEFEKLVTVKPGEATRVIAFVSQTASGHVVALGQTKL